MLDKEIDLFTWKEYNPEEGGLIFTYTSSLSSDLPIRDLLDEQNKGIIHDPNIESLTFGYYDCLNIKERLQFVDNSLKYAFFMTKYNGTNEEYHKKLLITGYMEVSHIKNMYGRVEQCFNLKTSHKLKAWWAFYGQMKFVSTEDAIVVDVDLLKKFGNEKATQKNLKQQTIVLSKENAEELVALIDSKDDATEKYLEEMNTLESFSL